MTVARYGHCTRKRVTLLHHDLMTDSTTRGVKINILGARKVADCAVLGKVLVGFVLYVVIEGEDWLSRVEDVCCDCCKSAMSGLAFVACRCDFHSSSINHQ